MEPLLRACPMAASFLVSACGASRNPLWKTQAHDGSRVDILLFPRKWLEGKEMTEGGNGERDPSEPGPGPSGPCLVRAHM